MRLKFIGTDTEQSWLIGKLRNCILRTSKPYKHQKSDLNTIYYDVTVTEQHNPNLGKHHNHKQNP